MAAKATKTAAGSSSKSKEKKAAKPKKAAAKPEASARPRVAKKAGKAPSRPRKSTKAPEDVRIRVYWGVFNQAMKRVALYDFSQRRAAEKRVRELNAEGKSLHFVQKIKQVVAE